MFVARAGFNLASLAFFDEAGFEGETYAVYFAVDLMVAGNQANVFGFGTMFQNLRGATQLQILDEGDRVAFG